MSSNPPQEKLGEGDQTKSGGGVNGFSHPSTVRCMVPLPITAR
jgi:hypothetical protein